MSGIVMMLANACYYDNAETLYGGAGDCSTPDVTYVADIKQIMDAQCATSGCHVNGTGRVDLSDYTGVQGIAADGQLESRVLVRKDMPPVAPLSLCDQQKIKAWIQNGANNN